MNIQTQNAVDSDLQRIAFVDPIGGIAGDMLLSALVRIGMPVEVLEEQLRTLGLPGWTLCVESVNRRHVNCTHVQFEVVEEHHHRHLPEILKMIEGSSLNANAKEKAVQAFTYLAEAEAKVHGIPVEQVHFHEVGAADAILDICGVCLASDYLGVREWKLAAPLPGGSGVIRCAHGEMPCPAPAVMELIEGVFPWSPGVGEGEMVTPTGAALLRAWVGEGSGAKFSDSAFTTTKSGFGAGSRESSLLRISLLEETSELKARSGVGENGPSYLRDEVLEIQCNLDDCTPETLGFLLEELMSDGALDVFIVPTLMKKSRSGHLLTCLCSKDHEAKMVQRIFQETGTLGMRVGASHRWIQERWIEQVDSPWGTVKLKCWGDRFAPEYEDCARIARENQLPLNKVVQTVSRVYEDQAEKRRERS